MFVPAHELVDDARLWASASDDGALSDSKPTYEKFNIAKLPYEICQIADGGQIGFF